eukprot:TRINITY_DN727_c1_g1_i1.p1 TRINITY_DN727_c1_g1~~TRINITY_DN727_c1_g1_i1.p1  ORF type:complete len:558 (-),score=148.75 TRINITY_DN727_c1_g1_i1:133-1806(-)
MTAKTVEFTLPLMASSSSSSSSSSSNNSSSSSSSASVKVVLSISPYVLRLRSAFGTSHSSTTSRTNALLSLHCSGPNSEGKVIQIEGFGEVGCPPKKRGCYQADYQDLLDFFTSFCKQLATFSKDTCSSSTSSSSSSCSSSISSSWSQQKQSAYDPFHEFLTTDSMFFQGLHPVISSSSTSTSNSTSSSSSTASSPVMEQALRVLFFCLDSCYGAVHTTQPSCHAALCGFEMMLMDAWSRLYGCSVHHLILPATTETEEKKIQLPDLAVPHSFYTASLNDDIKAIVDCARFGLDYTPLLKIKLDANIQRAEKILQQLHQLFVDRGVKSYQWSIDANASWTPALALDYLTVLRPYRQIIYMVEQPFPLLKSRHSVSYYESSTSSCSSSSSSSSSAMTTACLISNDTIKYDIQSDLEAWKKVKSAYEKEGLLIYGDESVANEHDVDALHEIMHGCNFKLEKTGGFRGAIKGILAAQKYRLKVWIGSMVSSCLNCSGAAQLLPFATDGYGDLDGNLLVTEESQLFSGGFTWRKRDGALEWVAPKSTKGVVGYNLTPKKSQ